jgi:hypothetical protein
LEKKEDDAQKKKEDDVQNVLDAQNILSEYDKKGYVCDKKCWDFSNVKRIIFAISIAFGILLSFFEEKIDILPPEVKASSFFKYFGIILFMLLFYLFVVPVHELLHAIGFLPGCGWKWKGNFRFGFFPYMSAAYCHCRVPQTRKQSIAAILLPFFVLSGSTLVLWLITQQNIFLFAGILHTISCIGDFYYVGSLLRNKADLILDSPSEVGYYTLKKS